MTWWRYVYRFALTLTPEEKAFLEPKNATHRQYEALRAFFVDKMPSAEAAERFGYTPGSFRVLCHQFRREPERQFFVPSRATPRGQDRKTRSDRLRERVVELRKQNMSVYDISRVLAEATNERDRQRRRRLFRDPLSALNVIHLWLCQREHCGGIVIHY